MAVFAFLLACGVLGKSPNIVDADEMTVAKMTPVMDGDVCDWKGMEWWVMPKFKAKSGDTVEFEEFDGGKWNGKEDQEGMFAVSYDDNAIYVGYFIVDDLHENKADSAWKGDSMQIQYTNAERTEIWGQYDGGYGTKMNIQQFMVPGSEKQCEQGYKFKRVEDSKISMYEIGVKKEVLGVDSLEGAKFGLSTGANDGDTDGDDQEGQKGWSGWGPHGIMFGVEAADAGLLTLGGGVCSNATDGAVMAQFTELCKESPSCPANDKAPDLGTCANEKKKKSNAGMFMFGLLVANYAA